MLSTVVFPSFHYTNGNAGNSVNYMDKVDQVQKPESHEPILHFPK